MNLPPLQSLTRAPLVLLGLTFALLASVTPQLASAEEFCQEEGTRIEEQVTQGLTRFSAERYTPCARNFGDLSYNVCFEASPVPQSTMPKWLAQYQAEEAVSQVFATINDLHADHFAQQQERARPLHFVSERAWLSEVIARMEQASLPAEHGSVCIETHDETCQSPPGSALSGSSTKVFTVKPTDESNALTPPPQPELAAQRALVELRVGPSLEHRDSPERPPPA